MGAEGGWGFAVGQVFLLSPSVSWPWVESGGATAVWFSFTSTRGSHTGLQEASVGWNFRHDLNHLPSFYKHRGPERRRDLPKAT